MSRIRFSDRQISDMIMELIGEVEPIGETNEDNARFDNLIRLQNTVDILLDEVYSCCIYSERAEYSMKRSADTAIMWLKEKRCFIDDVIEEQEHE